MRTLTISLIIAAFLAVPAFAVGLPATCGRTDKTWHPGWTLQHFNTGVQGALCSLGSMNWGGPNVPECRAGTKGSMNIGLVRPPGAIYSVKATCNRSEPTKGCPTLSYVVQPEGAAGPVGTLTTPDCMETLPCDKGTTYTLSFIPAP